MEADWGSRWRIEAAGELGQRLLLFFGQVRMLGVIVAEGYRTGERGGFLETDCVGTVSEGVPSVVGRFARWQGWSIGHRPLLSGGE